MMEKIEYPDSDPEHPHNFANESFHHIQIILYMS